MAYTYDITTTTGKIRALVDDRDVSGSAVTAYFTDEEIEAFLSMAGGNLFLAAALALRTIAGAVAPISYQTGDLKVDKKEIGRQRERLAERYEKLAYSTPAEYVDSVVYDIDKFGQDNSEYINSPDSW